MFVNIFCISKLGREVPAIELYPEATQIVIRGGSALFQCRVTAGIPTPTVEWIRADGSPFTSSTEIVNSGVIRLFVLHFICKVNSGQLFAILCLILFARGKKN